MTPEQLRARPVRVQLSVTLDLLTLVAAADVPGETRQEKLLGVLRRGLGLPLDQPEPEHQAVDRVG